MEKSVQESAAYKECTRISYIRRVYKSQLCEKSVQESAMYKECTRVSYIRRVIGNQERKIGKEGFPQRTANQLNAKS